MTQKLRRHKRFRSRVNVSTLAKTCGGCDPSVTWNVALFWARGRTHELDEGYIIRERLKALAPVESRRNAQRQRQRSTADDRGARPYSSGNNRSSNHNAALEPFPPDNALRWR